MKQRIQKILSANGVCSRRKGEDYLLQGRVEVNGRVANLGDQADAEVDTICLDGKEISRREEMVYIMLNKPKGYVTTLSDEQGRPTVMDLLQGVGVRVYPVGRLDLQSEGLLLFTNDGDFMHRLLHPKHEVDKTYHVWVHGPEQYVDACIENLQALRDIGGEEIAPAKVKEVSIKKGHAQLLVTIHQGKKRQVRRMCAACQLKVDRLRRVQEHHLTLGTLKEGAWRHLTAQELAGFDQEI